MYCSVYLSYDTVGYGSAYIHYTWLQDTISNFSAAINAICPFDFYTA